MSATQRAASTMLPTRYGDFSMSVFIGPDQREHVALVVGDVRDGDPVLVRIHSECLTGDVFGSRRCDCGEQLDHSLKLLQAQGRGVLLYLRQEGRGVGLTNKILAYALQDQGLDTVDANRALGLPDDMRDYGVAAEMLRALGVAQVRLLTNNPLKIEGLEHHGLIVDDRLPMVVTPNTDNLRYLQTKHERMGHLLPATALPAITT
jgi:GTP cyclohydrolase II